MNDSENVEGKVPGEGTGTEGGRRPTEVPVPDADTEVVIPGKKRRFTEVRVHRIEIRSAVRSYLYCNLGFSAESLGAGVQVT